MTPRGDILTAGRRVLRVEAESVASLAERLDQNFVAAVELVLACSGKVVVTGIGKSGAIGRKVASTLASTGTPAQFLHAAEALHGDMGMMAPGDLLVAISYSGRSDELMVIVPAARAMGIPIVALTGKSDGFLAAHCDIVLHCAVDEEACSLNLAPTASTTAALAMGDALAICAMEQRGFATADFARFHPGGALGRGLLLQVSGLMRTGERIAVVGEAEPVRRALERITEAQAGAAMITDAGGKLSGYLSDGDVRRHLLRAHDPAQWLNQPVGQVMTRSPLSFRPEMSAREALRALQERRVDDAPVVDENNVPVGWLDEQELLRAGLS